MNAKKGKLPSVTGARRAWKVTRAAVLYGKVVTLNKEHLKASVVLDLGMVKTCAEVHVNGKLAGVRLARPFRFEITDLVREGENEIQIRVVNTLANHMSSYPTKSVYKGKNSFSTFQTQ